MASHLRLVRPGGTVALEEVDTASLHHLPPAPAFGRLKPLVIEAFRRAGGDPDAAATQLKLFHSAGIEPDLRAEARALAPGHPGLQEPLQSLTALDGLPRSLVDPQELERLRSEAERELQGAAHAALTPSLDTACWPARPVAMSGSTTCPGCGLQLPASGLPWDPRRNASSECWQLYGQVQGFALNHRELVRDFHQLTMETYAAQHAPGEVGGEVPPISVAYTLVGLHLALDCGMSGPEVRAAHQRMGKPDPSWPRLPTPERTGAMTVFDVAAAGAMVGSVAGTPRRCGRGPPPSGRPGRSSTPGSPRSPTASCGDRQPSRRLDQRRRLRTPRRLRSHRRPCSGG